MDAARRRRQQCDSTQRDFAVPVVSEVSPATSHVRAVHSHLPVLVGRGDI